MTAGGLLLYLIVLLTNILPGFVETGRMCSTIYKQNRKLKQTLILEESMDAIRIEQDRLKSQLQTFVLNQHQDTQLSMIVDLISKTANEAKITVESMQPGAIEKQRGHLELPMSLSVSGTYHDLGKFVNQLEMTSPVIKIVQFDVAAKSIVSNTLHANIRLIVYYLEQVS